MPAASVLTLRVAGLSWQSQQLVCLRNFYGVPGLSTLRSCVWQTQGTSTATGGAATLAASVADGASTPIDDGHTTTDALDPGLYIVSTPIGNLEDITLRALRVLRTADLVLAEDTRHTRQLFSHFGIRTPLESYHQHNEQHREGKILQQLQLGASIALVSDAGTPAINDPGAGLVAAAAAAGLPVVPVPGPSAVLAGLVASGLPTNAFLYCGFTAAKSAARRKQFAEVADQGATLLFFVPPHSLVKALEDAAAVLGSTRRCCLARELTKRHEELWRGSLAAALQEFTQRAPRGEFVLVVEGATAQPGNEGEDGVPAGADEDAIMAALRRAVAEGHAPSAAARLVAQQLGRSKKLCYALSLTLSQQQGPHEGGGGSAVQEDGGRGDAECEAGRPVPPR